ncbi:hypothetical protein LIER_21468 [Lithospermum erythrorhizon]|uniref:Uncharacterized protein n=1 Tax=Lithospermum erythrorhizon TaxID=34254 RepID=A0AAV3QRK1_LITER
MFRFIFKSIHSSSRISEVFKLYSTSAKNAKKPIFFPNGNQDSFTVQYLIKKCGFSIEKAVIVSTKYVKFDKPDKPDSVIYFLKHQGFTESQIRKMLAIDPRILSANCENTLLPKIEFFRSKGATMKDLVRILVFSPTIFKRSLEGYILPSFDFIKDYVGSDKDVIIAISTCPKLLLENEVRVKPSVAILLWAGMSQSQMGYLMKKRPQLFVSGSERLKESVKQVQELGMDPRYSAYGFALAILTITRRVTWDKRMEAYKSWGCSEDDVWRTFKILPFLMSVSVEQINGVMSLFVHEIGWQSSEVVKKYFMFTLSLKKRMIPRWTVYQELLSKGLVKNEVIRSTMFTMKEDLFLKKFVNCYKTEAPLLLQLYIEKQASK